MYFSHWSNHIDIVVVSTVLDGSVDIDGGKEVETAVVDIVVVVVVLVVGGVFVDIGIAVPVKNVDIRSAISFRDT